MNSEKEIKYSDIHADLMRPSPPDNLDFIDKFDKGAYSTIIRIE